MPDKAFCYKWHSAFSRLFASVKLQQRTIFKNGSVSYKRWSTNREAPHEYTQTENRLPCVYYERSFMDGQICKLLNQNLTIQATESNKRYSRLTVFNVLKCLMEYFVANVIRFLRNSLLSSKTVYTSRLSPLNNIQEKMASSCRPCIVHRTVHW